MIYKFTVPTDAKKKFPALNDLIKAERVTFRTKTGKFMTKGALMKKEWQQYISLYIRKELKTLKITKPIIIHYHYFEADHKRDFSNCHATFCKFCEDALQDCGTIINDNQKYVKGFTADFDVCKENPRVEVELEIVDTDLGVNPYQE